MKQFEKLTLEVAKIDTIWLETPISKRISAIKSILGGIIEVLEQNSAEIDEIRRKMVVLTVDEATGSGKRRKR